MDEHIERYKNIKKDSYEFINKKLSGFMKDVYPKETVFAAAKALGMTYGKKKFSVDSKEEILYIFDYAINEVEIAGKKIIQLYKEQVGLENEKEVEFSKAIENSYTSLFRIVNTSENKGLIFMKDLFGNGKNTRLTDIVMSQTTNSDMLIFTRIFSFEGMNISSGMHCAFPAKHENQLLREYMEFLKQQSLEDTQKQRFIFFYNAHKKAGIPSVY
ncbi:hypothetical protein [Clostridium cellulovorans]|uniref:Uncharacterized protein n=1 Tax=Clostridium cellulovorans (strain ATCC 35296 / DSM 3052 / OCM 3 / 743B) TaxID=573061 RepID=D9SVX5_CLOC7|nr:hypothetical protein [Clostridium cellulovorans]ADL53186.1 hypothetical protein Clocel_3510 [Clostridium cellulovorans 743B]